MKLLIARTVNLRLRTTLDLPTLVLAVTATALPSPAATLTNLVATTTDLQNPVETPTVLPTLAPTSTNNPGHETSNARQSTKPVHSQG